jgi:predicted peptidase
MVRYACLLGVFLVFALISPAADKDERGFIERVFKDKDKEAKYVLFVPHGYKGDTAFPLILFLHGAGEREGGKKGPVEVGLGPAIKKDEKKFAFFALFPRCNAAPNNWQADGPDAQRALAMLKEVEKDYKIDPKRIYLTGLSMGGYGTWGLAAKYPDRWAAIVPICGRGDPASAAKIKDIPCWAFHGDKDPAVKVEGSREIIKAMKDAGGNPKYTEYPGVGHNSWDMAYGTAELYDWLLMQKLK